jgi:hypothetical protein
MALSWPYFCPSRLIGAMCFRRAGNEKSRFDVAAEQNEKNCSVDPNHRRCLLCPGFFVSTQQQQQKTQDSKKAQRLMAYFIRLCVLDPTRITHCAAPSTIRTWVPLMFMSETVAYIAKSNECV